MATVPSRTTYLHSPLLLGFSNSHPKPTCREFKQPSYSDPGLKFYPLSPGRVPKLLVSRQPAFCCEPAAPAPRMEQPPSASSLLRAPACPGSWLSDPTLNITLVKASHRSTLSCPVSGSDANGTDSLSQTTVTRQWLVGWSVGWLVFQIKKHLHPGECFCHGHCAIFRAGSDLHPLIQINSKKILECSLAQDTLRRHEEVGADDGVVLGLRQRQMPTEKHRHAMQAPRPRCKPGSCAQKPGCVCEERQVIVRL